MDRRFTLRTGPQCLAGPFMGQVLWTTKRKMVYQSGLVPMKVNDTLAKLCHRYGPELVMGAVRAWLIYMDKQGATIARYRMPTLAAGKTGERGIWAHDLTWYCSQECAPNDT